MVQDPKEWRNQQYVVTVYNTLGNSKHYEEEKQFIIEAVNVLKPY